MPGSSAAKRYLDNNTNAVYSGVACRCSPIGRYGSCGTRDRVVTAHLLFTCFRRGLKSLKKTPGVNPQQFQNQLLS